MMARDFNGSTQYLGRDYVTYATYPFAYSCWFNADSMAGTFMTQIKYASAYHSFVLQPEASGAIGAYSFAGTWYGAVSSTTASTGVWAHACGVWASTTDRRAYLNGAGKGTNTTSSSPSGMDRTYIAGMKNALGVGAGWELNGRVCQAAILDLSTLPGATAALKATFFEDSILPSLAAGATPNRFPTLVKGYWPLGGLTGNNDNDFSGNGYDLTPVASPTFVDHYGRMLYPSD